MKHRRLEPEVMDDPALDAPAHHRALRGLARLNRISHSARTVWRALADLAPLTNPPLTVLDIATGGGDVPIALHRIASRAGTNLRIDACDLSDRALNHAGQAANRADAPIRFFELDALKEALPTGYDVITCSLFLHHLTDDQAVHLLQKMAAAARHRVIVNDLHRSRLGLLTVQLGANLLTRSPVVQTDGPRSVRAAFTLKEVRDLAHRAGLDEGLAIHRRGPWRWVLTWDR